jgi:hypothetical protein
MDDAATVITTAALGGLATVHLAWSTGSAFPFGSRAELADAVVGSPEVPPPAACVVVAVALVGAAALVGGALPLPRRTRRVGLTVLVGVVGGRGVLGLAGRTDLVSPGSRSPRFRRLDRRVYAPLCLALAAGSAHALARDLVD